LLDRPHLTFGHVLWEVAEGGVGVEDLAVITRRFLGSFGTDAYVEFIAVKFVNISRVRDSLPDLVEHLFAIAAELVLWFEAILNGSGASCAASTPRPLAGTGSDVEVEASAAFLGTLQYTFLANVEDVAHGGVRVREDAVAPHTIRAWVSCFLHQVSLSVVTDDPVGAVAGVSVSSETLEFVKDQAVVTIGLDGLFSFALPVDITIFSVHEGDSILYTCTVNWRKYLGCVL